MNLLKNIHDLPRIEKIKVMEFLWEELKSEEQEFASPEWHEKSLLETEKRMAEGIEKVINWSEAKQLLRKEFE